jgi:hypothetical protein
VISGKLPNDTIWWLSSDGRKVWIESKEIQQDKFKEKGYNIFHERIFLGRKEVGELTGSRLESRKYQNAWVIKLEDMYNVYPELMSDIKNKEIEEKKKKKSKDAKTKKETKIKTKINSTSITKIETSTVNTTISSLEERQGESKSEESPVKIKEPVKEFFSADRPYVPWIIEEVNKADKLIITFKDLKNKMGIEFEKMDDFRIYYGLNKILINLNLQVSMSKIKNQTVAIIKKI